MKNTSKQISGLSLPLNFNISMFLIVIKPSPKQCHPPELPARDSACSIVVHHVDAKNKKQNNLKQKARNLLHMDDEKLFLVIWEIMHEQQPEPDVWQKAKTKVFWQGFLIPQVFRRCFASNCGRLAADSCCECWLINQNLSGGTTFVLNRPNSPSSSVMIFRSRFCFLLHKFSISVANLMEEIWTPDCLICIASTSNDLCNKSRLEGSKT